MLQLVSHDALARLDRETKLRVLALMETRTERQAQRLFFELYPDEDSVWTGPALMGGLVSPGQTLHARRKYAKHLEWLAAGAKYRERCAMMANRVGKALRNGTAVATPHGWRAIETLRVGDEVIAGDGSITAVTGVYPQGVKPLYRLMFDGVETIDCCAEHLWLYQHPRARYPYRQSKGRSQANPFYGEWRVADTATILREVGPAPDTRMRVVMPTCKPWQLPSRAVPLDPYLLGLLIGDGCLTVRVGFSTTDQEILDAVCAALPDGARLHHHKGCDYSIYGASRRGGGRNPVMESLRELGLMGQKSETKRVPDSYLLNDESVRLAMLQGLMDTDGSIGTGSSMEFSSCSHGLAEDVVFLVHSLGGKARIANRQTHYTHNGERRAGQPSYRVTVMLNTCPFRLARKAERWNRRHNTENRVLHRVETADPGEATCISVAHPDRTYVTAHGIVTHNTFGLGGFELAAHLTGLYPAWWEGRRFPHPISAWAAGDTYETTRDILQLTLLGEVSYANGHKGVNGRGIIPGHLIGRCTWRSGVQDLVDLCIVRHVSGGNSILGFKSYDQGRKAFQGTGRHVIWFDEEPEAEVYGEALMRTATVNGMIMLTFTPLLGLSEVVISFLPAEERGDLQG